MKKSEKLQVKKTDAWSCVVKKKYSFRFARYIEKLHTKLRLNPDRERKNSCCLERTRLQVNQKKKKRLSEKTLRKRKKKILSKQKTKI